MKLPFEKFKQEIIIKHESETDASKGCNPHDRSVKELLEKGIIILDKPSGPTSHMAVDYFKNILGLKKAGHSGTLDPGVTGVLPIAIGKATRITHSLLTAGKEYICLMHMHSDHSDEELNKVLEEFTGTITQLPPKKSAVKRQLRKRTIYYIKVLDRVDNDVLFLVGCEAGTYIRKLVHDIGLALGSGAHMAELRRTKAGPFIEEESKTLQDIADAYHYYKQGDESILKSYLHPIERGVEHLRKVWIHDGAVQTICQGASLKSPGVSKISADISVGELVAVMTLKDELVMVGEARMNSHDLKISKRGVAVKPKQVFMEPGTY
ncbi:MAG: RNA-guided pseudouridylation complex pseudouridine synthase subunit Cbf5 [Candidatus Woesearchaeota archaeon]